MARREDKVRRPETQSHTHSRTRTEAVGARNVARTETEGGFVKREPGGEEENDAGGVPAKVE